MLFNTDTCDPETGSTYTESIRIKWYYEFCPKNQTELNNLNEYCLSNCPEFEFAHHYFGPFFRLYPLGHWSLRERRKGWGVERGKSWNASGGANVPEAPLIVCETCWMACYQFHCINFRSWECNDRELSDKLSHIMNCKFELKRLQKKLSLYCLSEPALHELMTKNYQAKIDLEHVMEARDDMWLPWS